jgi:hypothetical protein
MERRTTTATRAAVAEELLQWAGEHGAPVEGVVPLQLYSVCDSTTATRAFLKMMAAHPPPSRAAAIKAALRDAGVVTAAREGAVVSPVPRDRVLRRLSEATTHAEHLRAELTTLASTIDTLTSKLRTALGAVDDARQRKVDAEVRAVLRAGFARQLRREAAVAQKFAHRMESLDAEVRAASAGATARGAHPARAAVTRGDVARVVETVLAALQSPTEGGGSGELESELRSLRHTHGAAAVVAALSSLADIGTENVDAALGTPSTVLTRLGYREVTRADGSGAGGGGGRGGGGERQYADVTTTEEPLESVRVLLRQCQQEHIDRFTRAAATRARASVLRAELAQASTLLAAKLQEHYGGNKALRALASSDLDATRLVAELEAAVERTTVEIAKVATLQSVRVEALQALRQKHAEIKAFRGTVDEKQQLIDAVLGHNRNAAQRARIALEQSRAASTAELTALLARATALVERANREPDAEVELFERTPLAHLQWNEARTLRLHELAIRRLNPARPQVLAEGGSADATFQTHRGDTSVQSIVDLKRKIVDARARVAELDTAQPGADRPSNFTEVLRVKVERQDRHYTTAVEPVLLNCVSELDGAIRQATRGHALVDEWIHQPAQGLASGLKRGGLNIQSWQEKLRLPLAAGEGHDAGAPADQR